jgi:hypothetical protein
MLSGWIDTALALEEENRQLRALVTSLIIAIARNRDLLEFARGEIETGFAEEKAA